MVFPGWFQVDQDQLNTPIKKTVDKQLIIAYRAL